ncbi:MAG: hypothetical protein WCR42_08830 [bacterium]
MAENELTQFKKKNFWKFFSIMLILAICFIIIIMQLIKIQLVDRSIYEKIAKNQHESAIKLKAKRGNMYDRKGNLLVTTTELYTVGVDTKTLKRKELVCKILTAKTDKDATYYLNLINNCKTRFV